MAVLSFFQATSDPADGSSATTDLSGNGNSGTVYGGSWVDASYGGSSGRALRFPAGKTGIEWASKIAPSSGPFTVRLWVKCDSDSSVADKFLYSRANAAKTTADDYVFYFNDGFELRFLPVGGGGSFLIYSVDLRDDTWHQIVYSTDGTNQYLFLDDSQVATNALFSTLSDDATCDVFGAPVNDQAGGRGWDGDVSLIAVSDTVTDLATVQADYALGPFHNPFASLSTGLQGWWCPSRDTAGNGTTTLTDLSGNGNDGTLTNMDAATDWVADTDNGGVRALDFDGTNDFVAATVAAIDFPVSVSMWVNLDPLDTDARAVFSVSDPTASNKYIEVGLSGSLTTVEPSTPGSGRLRIDVRDANTERVYGTTVVPVSQWVHIVAVWESASTRKVYLDGTIEIDDATSSNAIPANMTSVSIGQLRSVSPTWYTTCRSDNVALYDRALTADEVTQLYNGGRSLQLVDLSTGLQGWWCPSRDTAGNGTTTLTDLSGNGNDGTLTNMDAATDWVVDTDNGGVRALDYDGVDDRVITTLSAPSNQIISLTIWFRCSASGIQVLGHSGSTSFPQFFVSVESGVLYLRFGSGNIYQTASSGLNDGAWHNATVTCNTATANPSSYSVYIDGVLISGSASGSSTWSDMSAYNTWTIASRVDFYHGDVVVDGFAIWDRALTAAEVTQLYNGGRSFNLLSTGTTQSIVPQLLLRRRRMSGGLVI